jgi:phage-related protein
VDARGVHRLVLPSVAGFDRVRGRAALPRHLRIAGGAGNSDKTKVEVLVVAGERHTLRAAVLADGSSPASEFFAALEPTSRRALNYRLERFAETGRLPAPWQVNALEDGLFELKLSDGSRLVAYHAGFRQRGLVVLTHGFVKKSPKTPRAEIERAKRIREEVR